MVELKRKCSENFTVVKSIDVTKNVSHALKLDTERRLSMIEEKCPAVFVPLIKKFSGAVGSRIYDELISGDTLYHAWVLKKK